MTTSIQDLDVPIAYALPATDGLTVSRPRSTGNVEVRVSARALTGMQKEAIVVSNTEQPPWRMICDEGHYLNGSDLAPPPLAFFSAGMASLYLTAIAATLDEAGFGHNGLTIEQDAYYAMQGSALRGTMTASANPVHLRINLPGLNVSKELHGLLESALSRTPVNALMRKRLRDTFSIDHNGEKIDTAVVEQSTKPYPQDPVALFQQLDSSGTTQSDEPIVSKLESAESVFEQDHGKGAGLKEEQKRILLIRSLACVRADGLKQIRVQIYRPIGSLFQFLVDEEINGDGGIRAPNGLAYVSAGIAFCYMTQLGRYAQISKKELVNYRIVQDTLFDTTNGDIDPVDTHVCLETSEKTESCQQIVDMAEQTCFLHAACRSSNKTQLHLSAQDAPANALEQSA